MFTLWLTAALSLVTALLLVFTGAFSLRRPVVAADKSALRAFAVWWFAAATILGLVGLRTVLFLLGLLDAQTFVVLRLVNGVALAIGLPGLLYYLIFVYTGKRVALPLLFIAYTLFFGFTMYYFGLTEVRGVEATTWAVAPIGGSTAPASVSAAFGLLIAGPILAAVVAYASLYWRVRLPEQRYRIVMVSAAFGLWFLPLLVAFLIGWNEKDWFPLVYQVPGILAATLTVLAYRPPAPLQRRWGDGQATMQ